MRQKFHTSLPPLFLIRFSENLRPEKVSAFGDLPTFEDEDRIVFGWAIKDLPDLFWGRKAAFRREENTLDDEDLLNEDRAKKRMGYTSLGNYSYFSEAEASTAALAKTTPRASSSLMGSAKISCPRRR